MSGGPSEVAPSESTAKTRHPCRFLRVRPAAASTIPLIYHHPWLGRVMDDFDPDFYLGANPQVRDELGAFASAEQHFRRVGYGRRLLYTREGSAHFDPDFYRSLYPELALPTAEAAMVHYQYLGRFESRIPNPATLDACRSRIHLFQMGKVGSKAILDAITRATGEPVLHAHSAESTTRLNPHIPFDYIDLLRRERSDPIHIVSGVRDPIGRAVSHYFEEYDWLGRPRESMTDDLALREIRGALPFRTEEAVCWFDHGFYEGVRVYDHAFNHGDGYCIIEAGALRIFLYRFERVSDLNEPLGDFLGIPNLSITRVNAAEDKWYDAFRRKAADNLRVDPGFIDRIAQSRYAQHFFTEDERSRWYARWGQVGSPPA